MIVRLDPRPPLVWRSPTSLQIGVDPVRAVLPHVDDGVVRIIGALGTGVTRAGLEIVAQRAGVGPARVDELLAELAPALQSPESTRVAATAQLLVIGGGIGAARIAEVLAESAHDVLASAHGLADASPPVVSADRFGVLVAQHVVHPSEQRAWLRRDSAHVPVVFGEHAVVVGPLVVPGHTACLGCVTLHRTDADPAWPAISTQLWGRAAAAESPLLATRAALEVIELLGQYDAATVGGAGASARGASASIRLDALTGERTMTRIAPHPQCGCRGEWR